MTRWRTAMGVVVLARVLLGPVAARAAVTEENFALHSAADLAALCGASPAEPYGTAALNLCQGFSTGVVRVLYDITLATGHPLFCLPVPNPTRAEVTTAFSAWVGGNPARMASPAEDALLRFLRTQYACEESKR